VRRKQYEWPFLFINSRNSVQKNVAALSEFYVQTFRCTRARLSYYVRLLKTVKYEYVSVISWLLEQ
jgi:hypothetical protein